MTQLPMLQYLQKNEDQIHVGQFIHLGTDYEARA